MDKYVMCLRRYGSKRKECLWPTAIRASDIVEVETAMESLATPCSDPDLVCAITERACYVVEELPSSGEAYAALGRLTAFLAAAPDGSVFVGKQLEGVCGIRQAVDDLMQGRSDDGS